MDGGGEALSGGNASGPVVRVGGTVRKPWTAASGDVVAFMGAVRAAGVDVPAAGGPDEVGRLVLEYVPGPMALGAPALTRKGLARVGGLVRAVHDASAAFRPRADAVWQSAIPAPGADLVCHNDLAPWNLVTGDRWVFIDWDAAAPSTRLWDLAYAAQAFTLLDVEADPATAGARLAAFVDGDGAGPDLRDALPRTIVARSAAMHELLLSSAATGRAPWAAMHDDGHGAFWAAATRYAAAHEAVWSSAIG